MSGTGTDSTELKHARQALQETEEKYRLAMEAVQDGLWDWDVGSGSVYYSPGWKHILGEEDTRDDDVTWKKRIHPDDRERVLGTLRSHLAGETPSWREEHRLLNINNLWIWVLGRGRVVERDRNGAPLRMVGTMADITQRKRAEEKLNASERFNKGIVENSSDCIKILDLDGCLRYMNEAGQKLLCITDSSQYLGRPYDNFWAAGDKKAAGKAMRAALEGHEGRFTGCAATVDGIPKWWDVSITPMHGKDRKLEHLLVISRDITQRKQAEDALAKSERLLKQAQTYAHIGYWSLESDMSTATWSDETYRILGLDPSGPSGLAAIQHVIHPDDIPQLTLSLGEAMKAGQEHSLEYRVLRADGDIRWATCKGAPMFDENGDTVRLTGFVQDITERKLSEQRLRHSLDEKEVLLREIHHRVKNNLQVVASLLSLQAMQANVTETAEALQESARRIQLMAQIHNRLYRSSDLANVAFDNLIQSLGEEIIASYGLDSSRIRLVTELQPIKLHIDQALPCSQIVSELVSNSLKHAFSNAQQGTITIGLSKQEDKIELCIADNGVGIPPSFDWQATQTLGLQLVHALVQQLDGDVTLLVDQGTRFRVTF